MRLGPAPVRRAAAARSRRADEAWMLLQPRDYINCIQLFVGLGLLTRYALVPVGSSSRLSKRNACCAPERNA